MNAIPFRLVGILVLLIGFTCAQVAAKPGTDADPVVVSGADPAAASQGTLNLDVTITGSGFDNSAKVSFFITGTEDPGGIVVNSSRTSNPNTIVANIDIADTANVADFDIDVQMSRGRGGRGTTLFSVETKPNEEIVFCDVFGPQYPSECNCSFSLNQETNSQGTPPGYIYNIQEDCWTTKTLHIPQFGNLRSLGAVQGEGSERKTITAVAPFLGSSVIVNTGHRATARDFDILIGPGVAAGCDGGVETALRFTLEGGVPGWPDPADPSPDYQHARWRIQSVYVNSPHDPLCYGIVARRDASYTDAYPNSLDSRIIVDGGWIMMNSFERSAVVFEGFRWLPDALNPPEVLGIRVDQQATGFADAVGVEVGNITSANPAVPVATRVEGTLINLSGSGTGILAYGEEAGATQDDNGFNINNNSISGADLGIFVDDTVESVNFAGNDLTGVGGDSVAICSLAATTTDKGKPNRTAGYGTNGITSGCLDEYP